MMNQVEWIDLLQKHDVLVSTPSILLNALDRGFVDLVTETTINK